MAGHDGMSMVRNSLRKEVPRIERATYSSVEVTGDSNTITITARWVETKAGPAGELVEVLSRQDVLGTTAMAIPRSQRPVKTICQLRRDLILKIQTARKV